MAKWLLMIIAVSVVAGLVSAQTPPVQAPDDVVLEFKISGDQREFRLGELIPVSYSYRSTIRDKYIYVDQSRKLEGGRDLEIACSPAVERVRDKPSSDGEFLRFENMLAAPCGRVGSGIGFRLCSHCDWEQPLTVSPLGFGSLPLNMEVRFRNPGRYTCVASSATVTTAAATEKIRTALLVRSAPVSITIVADPAWLRVAADTYSEAFRKVCRGDDVPTKNFQQCSDLAQRITYLDTRDSLAAEVRFYDGRNHGWDTGFWDAIRNSAYRSDALRLMTARMQDPDFQVGEGVVELLAFWDLQTEDPDIFQTTDDPEMSRSAALDKLRKYARLLGSSLEKKQSDVLGESVKSYQRVAERPVCEEGTLIAPEERRAVLSRYKAPN